MNMAFFIGMLVGMLVGAGLLLSWIVIVGVLAGEGDRP